MRAMLASALAVNDLGEAFELSELVSRSVSNPAIRRGELMVRSRGLEDIARAEGHVSIFVTLTCPSRFHPQRDSGGDNPRFDGASVRDAQAWLGTCWARVRAKLQRLGILIYGFRVAEPHHDGTPHWHLLLHTSPTSAGIVRQVIRDYWLEDSPHDPGAQAHRVTFLEIDPAKGSATGYLAKYIAKNIDGAHIDVDHETGIDGFESAMRVDAWAATHRVRQFQQIGGPPVGLWRELRRLRSKSAHAEIEAARAPVDTGDYRSFVDACGGIATGRMTRVRLWKADDGSRNRYGERRGPRVIGLESAGTRLRTRFRQWWISFGAALARVASSPWTRVNNCTPPIPRPFGASPAQFTGRQRSPPVQSDTLDPQAALS
jgi:hypothetical protein